MESVWKSKLRIVYVTNVEASVANDVSKIAECTRHEIEALGGPNIVASEQVFDKRRVELWTFAKLAHHLQLHRSTS
jgi:hypothetical protein